MERSLTLPEIGAGERAPGSADPAGGRAAFAATALLVIAGLYLRSRGVLFGDEGLWLDECTWAIRLIERPLSEHLIRPIGFMALAKWLVALFGPAAPVLRALPWAAGIATTLLAPLLARELLRGTAARLLLVAVIALHPGAIDLAKEFKPYSSGLALHIALAALTLLYARTRAGRHLALLLGLAVVGVLFTQDAVFAYPGLFLVAGSSALRARRSRHAIAVGAGALLVLACVATLYLLVWKRMDPEHQTAYWGNKYDVFFVVDPADPGATRLGWLAEKATDLAAMPGIRREIWAGRRLPAGALAAAQHADRLLWAALSLAGLLVLATKRRGREALVVVLPLAVMTAFNLAGRWPYGAFRTNLFALAYVAPLAACAFDTAVWGRRRLLALLPAGLLVVLPLVSFEETWHAKKRVFAPGADFPAAYRTLIRLQGPLPVAGPELLALDMHGCSPWDFHTRYEPATRRDLGEELARRFDAQCLEWTPQMLAGVRENLRRNPGGRAWLLFTKASLRAQVDGDWPADLEIVGRETVRGQHLILGVRLRP